MFNPTSRDFLSHPYRFYPDILQNSPICYFEPWNAWFLFKHSDCKSALRDQRLGRVASFTEDSKGGTHLLLPILFRHAKLYQTVSKFMLLLDPPDHTRIRATVQRAFSARRVQELRPMIASITESLLADLEGKIEIDLITDFAFPLPVRVIEKMLGIPHQDQVRFRKWTRKFVSVLELAPKSEELDSAAEALEGFSAYVRELLTEKAPSVKYNPDDCEDLLTSLLAAGKGDQLTEEEIIATVLLLMIAGHETTVHMLGNGIRALLMNPAEKAKLLTGEVPSINVISEILRFDSPVQTTARRAKESCQLNLGERTIKLEQGQDIIIMLGAANHDADVFPSPDIFDVSRKNSGDHLAFGNGIHHCLGAVLAEVEGQIAIPALLEKFPHLRPRDAITSLRYLPNFVFRGLEEFPVLLSPVSL